jgi:hypothetical protein
MRVPAAAALAVIMCLASEPALAEVRAGAASGEFSLPAKTPLAGYSRRGGRASTGAHDPVGVRALVLQDADSTVALASCDLLIIDEQLFGEVRRRLRAGGLPDDAVLLVAATHTHSGPGAYGAKFFEKVSMGHFQPEVFDEIAGTISRTILEAAKQPEPVRVAYGAAKTEGLVLNRMEQDGEVDPEISVISLHRAGAQAPLAVIVNFAAHPTSMGSSNFEMSADYPGAVVAELGRRYPGAAVLFFAGAVGDQGPAKEGDGFMPAERIGRALAVHAAALIDAAAPADLERVDAAARTFRLDAATVRLGALTLPRWLGKRLVDDDASVSVVRVGGHAIFGVPCDLAVSFGSRLKAAARDAGLNPIIAGFANDYIGYCMPASVYESGAYEASLAFNGPRTGEQVVEELIRLLGEAD